MLLSFQKVLPVQCISCTMYFLYNVTLIPERISCTMYSLNNATLVPESIFLQCKSQLDFKVSPPP